MQTTVINHTAAKAFAAAVERRGAPADTSSEDFASTTINHAKPLTALQQTHADAKARAAKIAARETGVCSVYDLGEIIAGMEDEANVYWAAHDSTAALALGKFAKQLKELIPALRLPILPKGCPHCGAGAKPVNDDGKIYVQCSNKASCPVWPQTQNKLSLAAAVTAWNNDETR